MTVIPQVLARPRHVSLDNLTAAAAIYNSLYAVPEEEGGGVFATFQIVSLSGWVGVCCHDVICSMPTLMLPAMLLYVVLIACSGARCQSAESENQRKRGCELEGLGGVVNHRGDGGGRGGNGVMKHVWF
jgi:hypothetical protein